MEGLVKLDRLSMPIHARAARLNWRLLRKRIKTSFHARIQQARAAQTAAEGREGQIVDWASTRCPDHKELMQCLIQPAASPALLNAPLKSTVRTFSAFLTTACFFQRIAEKFAGVRSGGATFSKASTRP